MSKHSRSGGKYGGTHTTLIPAAALVCDIASRCPEVKKISPGFITSGLRNGHGRRVKLKRENGAILLSIRDNTSHQEVRVYTGDVQAAMLALAKRMRDAGIKITIRTDYLSNVE